MKITYSDFEKTIRDKLERENGQSQFPMLKGGVMNFSLSKKNDGIKNDHPERENFLFF